MPREFRQDARIQTHAGLLHSIEQRRERQFNLAIDAAEVFFVNSLTQSSGDLRGQVGRFGRAPVGFRPAFGRRGAALFAGVLARQLG